MFDRYEKRVQKKRSWWIRNIVEKKGHGGYENSAEKGSHYEMCPRNLLLQRLYEKIPLLFFAMVVNAKISGIFGKCLTSSSTG